MPAPTSQQLLPPFRTGAQLWQSESDEHVLGQLVPPPELLPPELLPPELLPPEVLSPELAPPELLPPEVLSPELPPPEELLPEFEKPLLLFPGGDEDEPPQAATTPTTPRHAVNLPNVTAFMSVVASSVHAPRGPHSLVPLFMPSVPRQRLRKRE